VGEANDMAKNSKDACSYLINSGVPLSPQDGEAQIIEVTKSGEETPISRKVFEKKYELLKAASLTKMQQTEGTLE
jgi:hypothetical protein